MIEKESLNPYKKKWSPAEEETFIFEGEIQLPVVVIVFLSLCETNRKNYELWFRRN